VLKTLIDSWQPFLKAGKPRWSWPCNAGLRRVLCSDHMLVCPPWSHRIVPQVMRHGSQKMLAEIGHLLGISYHWRTDLSFQGFSALPHFRWATWLRMWPGLEARSSWQKHETNPKTFGPVWKEVPQLFRVQTWIFVNLLVWRSTRNKRRSVLDIECFPANVLFKYRLLYILSPWPTKSPDFGSVVYLRTQLMSNRSMWEGKKTWFLLACLIFRKRQCLYEYNLRCQKNN